MKKNVILGCFLMLSSIAYSQVGINTANPQGIFHVDGAKDNPVTGLPTTAQQSNDFIVSNSGNVGIGTIAPAAKLDVNGNIKITDGTQGVNKILTSDANGVAKWQSPATLPGVASVVAALSFVKKVGSTVDDTPSVQFLGPDLSGDSNIRQILFDNILMQDTSLGTYNLTTKEFTANKPGYYNFQINLTLKGPMTATPRLGISRPYTGSLPTGGIGNQSFSVLSQNYVDAVPTAPVTLLTTGMLFLNAGEKIIFLTRFITPGAGALVGTPTLTSTLNPDGTITTATTTINKPNGKNSIDVESINYDRTFVNSVNITYYSKSTP
jgi:hypothetical protein